MNKRKIRNALWHAKVLLEKLDKLEDNPNKVPEPPIEQARQDLEDAIFVLELHLQEEE